MKVTIINNKKAQEIFPIGSLLLLVLGIFLTFNAEGVLSSIFIVLGILITLYGIFKFIRYYQIKNQFHMDDTRVMMSGVSSIIIGILTILLASFLTNAIQIITGIWLIFSGLSKLGNASFYKNNHPKLYITEIIVAVIFILLGIYSIFAENVVLVVLGVILILYSLIDLVNYFLRVSKK